MILENHNINKESVVTENENATLYTLENRGLYKNTGTEEKPYYEKYKEQAVSILVTESKVKILFDGEDEDIDEDDLIAAIKMHTPFNKINLLDKNIVQAIETIESRTHQANGKAIEYHYALLPNFKTEDYVFMLTIRYEDETLPKNHYLRIMNITYPYDIILKQIKKTQKEVNA